jgi:hypothetical protein
MNTKNVETPRYIGYVIDQLHSLSPLHTRYYTTYYSAHQAATRLCERKYGKKSDTANRMLISVS